MTDQSASAQPEPAQQPPRWQPLAAIDRRVAGVLVEKAKTTPEAYPMSLNAITTGCNQKSNRAPLMQIEPEQVAESLERLRHLGAVGLIEGYGRVAKYRHYLYDWLAVDKVELAVMAELLLRGDQTEGELRVRASRMEPIADLAALHPVLQSLQAKGLILSLTPEGRGHVITHNLYRPAELERVKAQYAQGRAAPIAFPDDMAADVPFAQGAGRIGKRCALRHELDELHAQVAEIRSQLEALATAVQQVSNELQRLKTDLGT